MAAGARTAGARLPARMRLAPQVRVGSPVARSAALAALVAALALLGCTEPPAGFVGLDRPAPGPDSARLTFSPGDDRTPAWGSGDTIVYAAAGFEPYPPWPSLALAIERGRGVASPVFPSLYATLSERWFVTPVPAPSGDGVAYVALDRLADTLVCRADTVRAPPSQTPVTAPRAPPLLQARLVVRSRSATGVENQDPQLAIRFAGSEAAPDLDFPGVPASVPRWLTRNYPFQQNYLSGGESAFRPSWSADGSSLVYGDGARLLVWRVGDPAATPLPGGDGLYAPAWSPRGDYVAATRPVVLDSTVRRLFYYYRGISCVELRLDYVTASSRLVLVSTDGAVRDLAEGDEPAWAPDGSAVYVHRASTSSIWRVPVAGGTPSQVPGTAGGEEPAVSRDGRYLAFTRRTSPGNHDLYFIRIAP